MPNLLPGEGMGPGGFRDSAAALFGSWPYVGILDGGVEHELGNVPEGVLTVDRDTFTAMGTNTPKRAAISIVTRVGMKFGGQINEFHRENVHALLGDAVGNTSLYVYVGAQKSCRYVSFSAKRTRTCDLRTIEAYIWKVQPEGLFTIGSGDGLIGSPFEFVGLDDQDGDFGGSATSPLGYVYLPPRT